MSIESLKWSLEHKVLFKRQLNSTGTRRRTVGQPHRYRQIKDIKGALFFLTTTKKGFINSCCYPVSFHWGISLDKYMLLKNTFARAFVCIGLKKKKKEQ